MEYNEQQLHDLTEDVKDAKKLKDKVSRTFSKLLTPELESQMSPQQKKAIYEANTIIKNSNNTKMSLKMNDVQTAISKIENIL